MARWRRLVTASKKAADFVDAQDDRQLESGWRERASPSRPQSLLECDAVEEFQGTEGLIVGAGGDVPVMGQVEQIGPGLGGSQDFGGLAEVFERSVRRQST